MQGRTGVRRASDVEAAPDDQLGVVAPDVHMRSPEMLRGKVRPSVLSLPQLTAAETGKFPSVSEPIPNSLRGVTEARRGPTRIHCFRKTPPALRARPTSRSGNRRTEIDQYV
ncbi:hypothetical protein GCM10015535_57770 [Streptomyces gelaticus]|uniref:Uncharacterized protein n=1 Tax=Streptomyces gelaticus TaxID=285446 RepID=A0ABQ2W8X6_9ACTN|nr:hypothetical protein GCM10015535_57770 [Streptomyces gelaticus]